jgi:NADH-quinone oxidoreductase subunit E
MGTRADLDVRWRKGRPDELRVPEDEADLSLLAGALEGLPRSEASVIPALQRAQEAYGYLPRSVLAQIANELRVPWAQVYGVATFYAQFHVTPRGKHTILLCRGTACHVAGAGGILEALERRLGIKEGETTPDQSFTLETVACLGACALAPVMVVDGDYHGHLDEAGALAVVDRYGADVQPAEGNDANGD